MTVHEARTTLTESRRMAAADDWPGALAAARQSVETARRAGDPAVLGAVLTNLAVCLGATGASDEALAAAQESADVFWRLRAQDPDAHEVDAALAYGVLSDLLDEADRPDDALAAMLETLELWRGRYRRDPSLATGLDLLGSLGMMDDRLMDVDRPDLRASVDDERRWLLREIAGTGPQASDDQVVAILARKAADLLGSASPGRGEDLAELVLDFVDGDDLDTDDDTDDEGDEVDLGPSTRAELGRMALARARTRAKGHPAGGVALCGGAVRRFRELEQEYPGRYRADLAAALGMEAELLAAAGQKMRARKVRREAQKLAAR